MFINLQRLPTFNIFIVLGHKESYLVAVFNRDRKWSENGTKQI